MEFIEKYKRYIIIGVVFVCIVVAVLTAGAKYNPTVFENTVGVVITPVQSFFSGIGLWVSERVSYFKDITELQKENQALRDEINVLQFENDRLSLIEAENDKLNALVNIDKKYPDYPKLGAHVIAKDMGNWYNIFIINKGTKDGIHKNMVVLGAGGLVGRVIEAGLTYAKVVSIIDDTSRVSVKSLRSDDTGVLRGDMTLINEGLCQMDYIDPSGEITAGDEIVTSHLSDIYPPGIAVGLVVSVLSEEGDFTKSATVKPFVDFKHLEEVLVITEVFENVMDKVE